MSRGGVEASVLAGKRNPHLDALRGVAVLLVVGHHAALRFGDGRGWAADFLASVGWVGVDIFFGISGFLVVRSLVGDSRTGFVRRFFVRRAFRIIPIYVVALCAYFAGQVVLHGWREGLDGFWIPALFLTSFMIPVLGEGVVPFTITWSVSVEEFAYILLGGMSAFGLLSLRRVAIFLIVTPVLIRAVVFAAEVVDPISIYYFAPTRMDAIGFGAAAALGGIRIWRRSIAGPLTVLSLLFIAFAFFGRSDWRVVVIGYTMFGVACASLVRELSSRQAMSNKFGIVLSGWLSRIGLVSYFIYLFHLFVVEILDRLGLVQVLDGRLGFLLFLVIAVALTYIAAEVSWRFIESPLISMGKRIGQLA